MDDVTAAETLISCLDLTSLNNTDTSESIIDLCRKAQTPYGNVAAVCVYPQFVGIAKEHLRHTDIKVATVINFPDGSLDSEKTQSAITTAVVKGADEIDLVFPYKQFLEGQKNECGLFIKQIKEHLGKKILLKVILETGELIHAATIAEAAKLCIQNGADFIKTSTGKTKVSATPEAANIILETIASGRKNAGFKASGGIKTIDDAKKYLVLAVAVMGGKWVTPKNFRIGASSLLDNLIEVINRGY